MEEAIQNFEKELKTKLEYKASSKISPDTYLYKSFKFFDLYNNGYLGKSDFFKAIAKCGVVVDTHDVEKVYSYYDFYKDGNIHYKEFIQKMLFSEGQQSVQEVSERYNISRRKEEGEVSQASKEDVERSRRSEKSQKIWKQQNNQKNLKQSKIERIYNECQSYEDVVELIKRKIRQKGIKCLLSLAVQLKSTDIAKNHKISKDKLKFKLNYLPQKAINIIISQFSVDHKPQINYAELIYSLKGACQPSNQTIIQKAFNLLDSNSEKEISIQRVTHHFKYFHFKQQFIQSINLYQTFQGIDDGVFTDQDFLDFFGFLAFYFSDSQQFVNFVQKAYFNDDNQSHYSQRSNRSRQFKNQQNIKNPNEMKQLLQHDFRKNKQEPLILNDSKIVNSPNMKDLQLSQDKKSKSRRSQSQADKKSTTTSVYVKQVEMIVLRIKKRLASKGTRGYLIFQKHLKSVDNDEDGLINLDQFKKVIRDLKIDITNNQSNLIFDVFDPDSTNFISYSELIHTLKGKTPQKRQQFFQRFWNTVKLSQQFTTFTQIRHALNFRGHPDIQTGRKYDDQIYKEIQQTILLIQQLNQTPRSQNVSKKQFLQYFQNLSLTTSQDMLFQSILQNFWKIQSKNNINQMYAGSRKIFDPSSKSYLMDHHRYAVKGGSISSNAPFGTSNEPTSYFTQHNKL